MATKSGSLLPQLVQKNSQSLLADWIAAQLSSTTLRSDLLRESELREQSTRFLAAFEQGTRSGKADINAPEWEDARQLLRDVSASRARQGFTPSETATFVFSLKEPLFALIRKQAGDVQALADEMWLASVLIDKLGLYTTEVYQQSRNDIINRQQTEMMELSTPVVELWDRVLGLPLVGTLDSSRTQVVMETLLQRIVDTEAEIAIIDITGVPTVDTLVAQHLLKTIAATRLMGADCIISGIRPQIAQTIVHLGVDLGEVITKATLADALAIALKRIGVEVRDAGE